MSRVKDDKTSFINIEKTFIILEPRRNFFQFTINEYNKFITVILL